MSTGIEALRAPRQAPWLAAVFALLVVMTVAFIATTVSVGGDRPDARFLGRHLVNTPAELRGVTVGARSGAGISFVRHVPRPGIGGEATEPAPEPIGANTPIEISGGLPMPSKAEIEARQQHRP